MSEGKTCSSCMLPNLHGDSHHCNYCLSMGADKLPSRGHQVTNDSKDERHSNNEGGGFVACGSNMWTSNPPPDASLLSPKIEVGVCFSASAAGAPSADTPDRFAAGANCQRAESTDPLWASKRCYQSKCHLPYPHLECRSCIAQTATARISKDAGAPAARRQQPQGPTASDSSPNKKQNAAPRRSFVARTTLESVATEADENVDPSNPQGEKELKADGAMAATANILVDTVKSECAKATQAIRKATAKLNAGLNRESAAGGARKTRSATTNEASQALVMTATFREELVDEITEKVAEKVTEKVTEKVAEKVAEKVTEKIAEKVEEEVTEKVTKQFREDLAAGLQSSTALIIQAFNTHAAYKTQQSQDQVQRGTPKTRRKFEGTRRKRAPPVYSSSAPSSDSSSSSSSSSSEAPTPSPQRKKTRKSEERSDSRSSSSPATAAALSTVSYNTLPTTQQYPIQIQHPLQMGGQQPQVAAGYSFQGNHPWGVGASSVPPNMLQTNNNNNNAYYSTSYPSFQWAPSGAR